MHKVYIHKDRMHEEYYILYRIIHNIYALAMEKYVPYRL